MSDKKEKTVIIKMTNSLLTILENIFILFTHCTVAIYCDVSSYITYTSITFILYKIKYLNKDHLYIWTKK